MRIERNRLYLITILAAILAVFIARSDFDVFSFGSQNASKRQSINKLNQVLNIVNNYYVDTLDWNEVSTGAIDGLLKKLDPHSVYFDPVAVEHNEENFNGKYQGIGIQFDVLDSYITVIAVIAGSPSEHAGLLAGDKITHIDGTSAKDIKSSDVPKKLKGPKGSTVIITIKRTGLDPFDVEIERDDIPIFTLNTHFMADEKTGYIWINRFASTTADEVEKALLDLEAQGMQQVLLDLRGNGGGYLRQAVEIVGKFIHGHKKVVYTKGRLSRYDETYYTDDYGMSRKRDYPLVILIDRSSASASEIVAGAIQDYDRGLIVGEQSFGKGLVQNEFELDDDSRIRLTVSKYYTPSGRLIQRPYKGKRVEDYYMESIHDSLETEQDSTENKPVFHTESGREVFGGGGIMPDVEVEFETFSKARGLTSQLHSKRIFFETASEFVVNNPQWKKSFNTFQKEFKVDKKLFGLLRKIAEQKEVEIKNEDFNRDEMYLKNRLKAEIARNIWGADYFYQILLEYDNQFEKALKLFPEIDDLLIVRNQK